MKKLLPYLLILSLLGSSCVTSTNQTSQNQNAPEKEELISIDSLPELATLFYPIDRYSERKTKKSYGQYIRDRFRGYHTGDDLEVFEDEYEKEIAVHAIMDGTVVYKNWVSGYGGVIILEHVYQDEVLQSLYGHIDLSQTTIRRNESIKAGTLLTYLGNHESVETDQERKHLHFAISKGSDLHIPGYVDSENRLTDWIDPTAFLEERLASQTQNELTFPSNWERHYLDEISELYKFSLLLPNDFKAEYVEEIESIAIFSSTNQSIDDALLFIRYFDANDFLTLSTVVIHNQFRLNVADHDAREYEIEKKSSVNNFPHQPLWRNKQHTVTDIKANDGYSRFYVIGQNPELDKKTVSYILESINIGK